jgi:hypothetical protein
MTQKPRRLPQYVNSNLYRTTSRFESHSGQAGLKYSVVLSVTSGKLRDSTYNTPRNIHITVSIY